MERWRSQLGGQWGSPIERARPRGRAEVNTNQSFYKGKTMAVCISGGRIFQQMRPVCKCLFKHHPQQRLVLHTSAVSRNWYEKDRKGGYDTYETKPIKDMFKEGFHMLPEELAKLKEEWLTKIRCDSVIPQEHLDYEVFWKFDSQESLNAWQISSDRDFNEGTSECELVLSKQQTAIFRGTLHTEPPKDGKTKYAGYCNVTSPQNYQSFHRESSYDWSRYSHIVMRVRGDGRNYNLLINMNWYYDINWNDGYSFVLFTRGGPYWQTAKIPLSKFLLQSKGRIQDKQEAITLDRIRSFNVMIADDKPGDFHLEIDYISLLYDASHDEKFAYEMYEVPVYKMG